MGCSFCNYSFVLLEHRRKYKYAKCGRLFPQKEIETKEFQDWNKKQRQEEKEKLARSREVQRKFREGNREGYNTNKREYWAKNKKHILEKREQNYNKKN